MDSRRVLVVDDDPDIRSLLRELFVAAGWEVGEARNGREALRSLYDAQPDVVLLDVAMPELDGWGTLERIRELSDVPVLMLTARATEADKVRGLRAGADDYVAKPFGLDEVMARAEALVRRKPKRVKHETFGDDRVRVDAVEHTVYVDGEKVELTPLEFKLLDVFVRHPNEALERQRLFELVWGEGADVSQAQVKLYVAYLRRKLERAGAEGLIETVRGIGYRYRQSRR